MTETNACLTAEHVGLSFDPFMATNGVLGGLVAITASSPMVETEGAFVIGVVSGVLVIYGSKLLLKLMVRPEAFSTRIAAPGSCSRCACVEKHY